MPGSWKILSTRNNPPATALLFARSFTQRVYEDLPEGP